LLIVFVVVLLIDKNSELFQGFLTDPTVFGASNKNDPLILTPGTHFDIGINGRYEKYTEQTEYKSKMFAPSTKINGYFNEEFPISYFIEADKQFFKSDSTNFGTDTDSDFDNDQYIIALGAKPTEKQSYFFYASNSTLDIKNDIATPTNIFENTFGTTISSTSVNTQVDSDTTQKETRLDGGFQYKFSPKSQFWFKVGYSDKSKSDLSNSHTNTTSTSTTQSSPDFLSISKTTTNTISKTKGDEDTKLKDIHLRQIFNIDELHDISFGLEFSSSKLSRLNNTNTTTNTSSSFITEISGQQTEYPSPPTQNIYDFQLADYQENDYSSVYIEDKYEHVSYSKEILVHYGMHYSKFSDLYNGSLSNNIEEKDSFKKLQPRLGIRYKNNAGWVLRGAYHHWVKPSSDYTIGSVSTAGIPIDENYVAYGGEKNQFNLQFEAEINKNNFIKIYG